jgi:hypothetical protein
VWISVFQLIGWEFSAMTLMIALQKKPALSENLFTILESSAQSSPMDDTSLHSNDDRNPLT